MKIRRNESRPPFYCNFLMEMVDGTPTLPPENAQILMDAFLVDHRIDNYQSNLRKLRGIAFDWARYNPIQDHVYGGEVLSRKLESSVLITKQKSIGVCGGRKTGETVEDFTPGCCLSIPVIWYLSNALDFCFTRMRITQLRFDSISKNYSYEKVAGVYLPNNNAPLILPWSGSKAGC